MEERSEHDAAGSGYLIGLLFGVLVTLSWGSGEPMLYVPITLVVGLLALACLIPERRP